VLDFLDPASGRHSFPVDTALRHVAEHGNGVVVLLYRPQSGQDLLAQLEGEPAAALPAQKWDPRLFGIGAQILRELKVGKMKLMASPRKIPSMAGFGLQVVGHLPAEA
jgi:3,4-dihydroxy 2-butanone 4-phosphate synthase/GTP cyclohydrolase II